MKKILTAKDMQPLLVEENSFLNRGDIKILTAGTNDEILKLHREEKADLIVTKLDTPGIGSDEFCDILRQRPELREVVTVIICDDRVAEGEQPRQCGAGEVLVIPVDRALLHRKVQQALAVAPRWSYRVTLNVAVEGKLKNRPFLFRTENISATGTLIRAEEALAPGDRIALSFYLPDGTRVSAQGEIVRLVSQGAGPGLYGIKFTDIAPGVKASIESFVEKKYGARPQAA